MHRGNILSPWLTTGHVVAFALNRKESEGLLLPDDFNRISVMNDYDPKAYIRFLCCIGARGASPRCSFGREGPSSRGVLRGWTRSNRLFQTKKVIKMGKSPIFCLRPSGKHSTLLGNAKSSHDILKLYQRYLNEVF